MPKYCEMGFHSQDGRPLYLEVISQTIMYQNAPAVMVTLHEVSACLQTSHEQTDLALRRSEAHYRTLYNQTPVMMVSIDPPRPHPECERLLAPESRLYTR